MLFRSLLTQKKKFSYDDVVFTPIPSRLGKDEHYDASWLDELDSEMDTEEDSQE